VRRVASLYVGQVHGVDGAYRRPVFGLFVQEEGVVFATKAANGM
jgi:hypothetical protein